MINKSIVYPVLLIFSLVAGWSVAAEDEEEGTFAFDGLVPVEESTMHAAYIDPDADFSVFERVAILEPHVAFRSNWLRDQNRSRSRNVRASDVDRIKSDVAGRFSRSVWKPRDTKS
jgi:hypothetical protein